MKIAPMKLFNPVGRSSRLLLAMLISVFSADEVQSSEDGDWKFTVAFPMIWVTDVNGTISIDGRTIDINTPYGLVIVICELLINSPKRAFLSKQIL